MKKQIFLFFGILMTLQSFSQIVNIPDANFKAYLIGNTDINTNGDAEIQVSEANSYIGGIYCYNMNISSLTGIEEFVNLIELICSSNQLTTLDLTNNINLKTLYCNHNQISNLNITANIRLNSIGCWHNQLTSLDVSNNIDLTRLDCDNNSLTSLDLSNNSLLTILTCFDNQISNLNVNNCISLTDLSCENNQFTSLDVSNNLLLTDLYCSNNQIQSLDLSNNLDLENIYCPYNQITDLDFSLHTKLTRINASNNNLNTLNVKNGFNTNISSFFIQGNPNLTCVTVDDIIYSDANWSGIGKDLQTYYDISCNSCLVYIPDANFKSALLNHSPTIDTDGDGEIQCSEALAVTGILNVANNTIVDTTGLEAFKNITRLAMSNNNITSIDVSSNLLLEQLLLEDNELVTIDVSILTVLTDFSAQSNLLTSANLANGNNTNMTTMQLQGNASLTCIQIDAGYTPTTPSWLKDSTANYNTICAACIVNIPDTNFKNALLNHYTLIDINNDGEIQCTEALAVTGTLSLDNNNITNTTGLRAFKNITRLALFNNTITSIDVSSNLLLEQLLLESNKLVTIDVSMLTVLTDFKIHSNLLTSASIANGNNVNMNRVQLQGNSSLNCVKIDAGFTPTTPIWLIDNTSSYAFSCSAYPRASASNKNTVEVIENTISVFPNPTRDTITINSEEDIEKITLCSLSGKVLMTGIKTNTLNLSILSEGVYLLVIHTTTKTINKKVIKE